MNSQYSPSTSRQVWLPPRYRYGGKHLVLENESLNTLKEPEKNQEHTDVLYPGQFDGFPEARAVGEAEGAVKAETHKQNSPINIIKSEHFILTLVNVWCK